MVKGKAQLHILSEYSPYAMGLVLITADDRAIIIDGGRDTEIFNVKAHVGDRPIAAWILTHTHGDHVGCIQTLISTKDPILDRVECFISNFHTPEFFRLVGSEGEARFVERFNSFIADNGKKHIEPVVHDEFDIDGLHFEIMFSKNEKYKRNFSNDASLAFRITGAKRNVLILGDLGPDVSEELIETHGENLRSDIVQMAHHGHACVSKAVYELIDPNACIWFAASWLWHEQDGLSWMKEGEYGTVVTRQWMDEIGHQEHYVTKDGDHIIEI